MAREIVDTTEYRIRSYGVQRVFVKVTTENGREIIREENHDGVFRFVRYGETPDDWMLHPIANDRVGLKRVE